MDICTRIFYNIDSIGREAKNDVFFNIASEPKL